MIELSEGLISSDVFEKLVSLFEKEAARFHFNLSSEANLLRIFSAVFDKRFFFLEITNYPHHAEILTAIAASSNYLSDIVVRNPEYLYQIFDQEYLTKRIDLDSIKKEITDGLEQFQSLNARLNYLRQFKKRIILKIGTCDILRLEELYYITQQLSFLAKAINGKLFDICFEETLKKYDVTVPSQKYCLCSLGKLGGNELNYSSDVDLILFYDFNSTLTKINKEYYELLTEAAQLFIKSSTEISPNGYIYRVDFRLRPDGKYSPLCKSLNDYIKYYEIRGEDWERQMLIKLDFTCGDEALFNQFFSFASSFVYSSSFSPSIKEKIRLMKSNIERENREKENVKFFSGGIRDIEFIVQALQLINGSRDKSIRTGNTLNAIEQLFLHKLLSEKERAVLTAAYHLFRQVEHFLQLMNDTQTHLIPEETELLKKLSIFIGYNSVAHFKKVLRKYRESVRKIYDQVLRTDEKKLRAKITDTIKFADYARAEKNLKYLRSGAGIFERKEFDSKTIELFNSIEPALMKYLKKCYAPDRALNNLAKMIRSTKFPSIWYRTFSNQKFFMTFLKICLYSQKAVDLFTLNNQLEEYFLSRKVFSKNFDEGIEELTVDELTFLCAVQFSLGLINSQKLSQIFTIYFSKRISVITSEMQLPYNFFVAALGSFGSGNMNFESDIDLIIIAENVETHPDIQKDFQKYLISLERSFKPFKVDFRLRPEGKSSPLVGDIENYNAYLSRRARTWEFQSLLKLKYISGNSELFNNFTNLIREKIRTLDKTNLKKEIVQMHSTIQRQAVSAGKNTFNVKKERGGLLTMDFILQFLCVNNLEHFKKAQGKNFIQIIKLLKNEFTCDDFEKIKKNFRFLKEIEIALQNIFNSSNAIIPGQNEQRMFIARFLGFNTIVDFNEQLHETIKKNNSLFEKYLGG